MRAATDLKPLDKRLLATLRSTGRCPDCGGFNVPGTLCWYCPAGNDNISHVPATRPLPGDPSVHV